MSARELGQPGKEPFFPTQAVKELVEIFQRQRELGPLHKELQAAIGQVLSTHPQDHVWDRRTDLSGNPVRGYGFQIRSDRSLLAKPENRQHDPLAASLIVDDHLAHEGVEVEPLDYLVTKAGQLAKAVQVLSPLQQILQADGQRQKEIHDAFRGKAHASIQEAKEKALEMARQMGDEALIEKLAAWFDRAIRDVDHEHIRVKGSPPAPDRRSLEAVQPASSEGRGKPLIYTLADLANIDYLMKAGESTVSGEQPHAPATPQDVQDIAAFNGMLEVLGFWISYAQDATMPIEMIAANAINELKNDLGKSKARIPNEFWKRKLAYLFEHIFHATDQFDDGTNVPEHNCILS